jgi:hypothetical protein
MDDEYFQLLVKKEQFPYDLNSRDFSNYQCAMSLKKLKGVVMACNKNE